MANKQASDSGTGVLTRVMSQPNTIVALCPSESAVVTLDICVQLNLTRTNSGSQKEKQEDLLCKSMAREAGDMAQNTIDRIRMLFRPKQTSASTKTSKETILASCPVVEIFQRAADGSKRRINPSALTNRELWQKASELHLGDDTILLIRYNIPTITSIVPPKTPYVGLPLVCSNVVTLFSSPEDIQYRWMKTNPKTKELELLSTSSVFIPTEDLLNERITLRVSPPKEEFWSQITLPPVLSPLPPMGRWKLTEALLQSPEFRAISYNILYEDFCTGKPFCRNQIYPFATDEVLDIENRKVRILQELLAYRGDLIGLQECGKRLFENFLLPALKSEGYEGVYANKGGTVQEGCGFVYRKERFKLLHSERFPLNWSTLSENFSSLANEIHSSHPELEEALANVTTIGFIAVMEELESGRRLIFGNTHLFYHANACHIRILQAYMFLHNLSAVSKKHAAGEEPLPIVTCGDCNFTHSTGAYRLFTTGQIEDSHHSWEKGKLFYWGCDRQLGYTEEEVETLFSEEKDGKADKNVNSNPAAPASPTTDRPPLDTFFAKSLVTNVKLVDAYGRMDASMPWTNYTLTFKEVIDYIMFSERGIDVSRVIPIPSESELSCEYALPNSKYPSDHVALIADLKFTS